MHLYEDLVVTEVVDDANRPVPMGTFGAKVLVTVLFSRTLPLIRYEMSDRVALRGEPCACGKPYSLVQRILGRTEDALILPGVGGAPVSIHPNVFHDVLDTVSLRGWQVVEEARGLRVRIAAAASDEVPADLAERLRAALLAHGSAVAVAVDRVEDITRTGAGKALVVRRATAVAAPTEAA